MKFHLFLILLIFFSKPFFGQELAPKLLVKEGDKNIELEISRISINVKVIGLVAQTEMTLSFFNPNKRPLAGDFYFPLPDGSVISSYALDIDGVLIDSVAVRKEKARVVYEKIVNRNVDPGLIEWTKGNNFKTGVFPIPANGTRTIKVSYVSALLDKNGTSFYKLPLNFSSKVKEGLIRVEILESIVKPEVLSSPSEITFDTWQKGFIAEKKLNNEELNKELSFSLPKISKDNIAIEESQDGNFYFMLHQFPDLLKSKEVIEPDRIDIIWDASSSCEKSNHGKSYDFLREYFSLRSKTAVKIQLFLLRNEISEGRSFTIEKGDCEELIANLKDIKYDGGTSLDNFSLPNRKERPGFCFLFSDGIGNMGQINTLFKTSVPIYSFNASTSNNTYFLRRISKQSGGKFYDLTSRDHNDVAKQIGQQVYSLNGVKILEGEAKIIENFDEVYSGRFDILGVIKSKTVLLELDYGFGNSILKRETITFTKDKSIKGEIVRKYWAQEKLKDLLLSPDENQEEICNLGLDHQMVTPETSLIVLENVNSYLEHKIVPPLSKPEWRKQYFQSVSQMEENTKRNEMAHLSYVKQLWESRINWWEKDFKLGLNNKARKLDQKSLPVVPVEMEEKARELRKESVSYKDAELFDSKVSDEMASAKKENFECKPVNDGEEYLINLKKWNPDETYLKDLAETKGRSFFNRYLELKKEYSLSPAFYFDCASFFVEKGQREIGLQVLSNIAELKLEDSSQLRILAFKLMELKEFDEAVSIFRRILKIRGEEPQSYRDLALALLNRGRHNYSKKGVKTETVFEDLVEGLRIQAKVVFTKWDRFDQIELIALGELNNYVHQAKEMGLTENVLPASLEKLLDLDIRIVLSWDTDMVDIDLIVIDPTGEKTFYGNPDSRMGGHVSRDFTAGYGPEEYILKKGMAGKYRIAANYFGSSSRTLIGPITLKADVYVNYGRSNEKHSTISLRLKESGNEIQVGDIEL